LKLGALITVSTRPMLIAITSSCPYRHIFATAHRPLRMLTNTASFEVKLPFTYF
jgi:hypothetical protein